MCIKEGKTDFDKGNSRANFSTSCMVYSPVVNVLIDLLMSIPMVVDYYTQMLASGLALRP